jgi:glycosyltransferase involved in cell wall biosynthesis
MQGLIDINFDAQKASGLVSCLCVTEARSAFMPWLLWNYHKQAYRDRELIVVDGSERDGAFAWPADVTVVRCARGASVARKRNLAMEVASGDIVAWFDDDDWQHPHRLGILATALAGGADVAGSSLSWFVDLGRGRARAYDAQRAVIFNGLGVRRDATAGLRFDERRARAADTAWVSSLLRERRCAPIVVSEVLSFWLCHRANLSNPVTRYVFSHPLASVRDAVGAGAWAETDDELSRLRERLA